MSRGHGRIQQHILDAVDLHGGVWPLITIADANGYDITKLSVRQSFSRAAQKLAAEHRVARWTIWVPSARNGLTGDLTLPREIMCVTPVDLDSTDRNWGTYWKAARRWALDTLFPEEAAERAATEREHAEGLYHLAEKTLRLLLSDGRGITRDRVTKLVTGGLAQAGRTDLDAEELVEAVMTLLESPEPVMVVSPVAPRQG
jgi:hypothetical protein